MAVSYKDYTRAQLATSLREHFGLQSTTDINTILYGALDEAQAELIRKRRTWHFLERPLVVNIAASGSGTANFTKGSTAFEITAGDEPAVRDVIVAESTTSITGGYLVTSFSSPSGTLDAEFVHATAGLQSLSCTSTKAYFELPENFTSMYGPLHDVEDLDTKIKYLPPYKFEEMVRNQPSRVGRPAFYTVVPDPLAEVGPQIVDRKQYLRVYPYMMAQSTLRGTYQVHPQNLDDDTSIPILPREYRPVLIDMARWKVALRMKYEANIIQMYAIQAADSVKDMLADFTFVDDPDESEMHLGLGFDFPVTGSPSQGDSIIDFA